MKKVILILSALWFSIVAYSQNADYVKLSAGVDSVVVRYWSGAEANEYIYCFSNELLQISSKHPIWCYSHELNKFVEHSIFERTTEDKHIIQDFKKYLNQFYIDKEKKIILKRTKRDHMISTDYPDISLFAYIWVTGYKNKKKIFDEYIHIGEEAYDVEYNPEFMEFYDLLKELVKSKCADK